MIDLDPQRTLSDAAALRMEEGIEPAIRVEAGTFSDVTLPEDAEEIIIDVGTADLESFKQAIMIADRILIPVTPSQADIWSTQRFSRIPLTRTRTAIHRSRSPSSTVLIPDKAIQASDQAAAALDALPVVRLIPQRLSDRAVFRDSFSEGLAVFELEPRSIASREFKALAETLFPGRQRSVLDRLRKAENIHCNNSKIPSNAGNTFGRAVCEGEIGYEDVDTRLSRRDSSAKLETGTGAKGQEKAQDQERQKTQKSSKSKKG